jgi:hypothetical protein
MDGFHLADIFNGWTGVNVGGGFFYLFPSTYMSGAYPESMSTTWYSSTHTYALGGFSNTASGTYYPGIGTIYTGTPSQNTKQSEFFEPGVGPVGLTFTNNTGGSNSGYFSTTEINIGLTDHTFVRIIKIQ